MALQFVSPSSSKDHPPSLKKGDQFTMKKKLLVLTSTLVLTLTLAALANAQCTFTTVKKTKTLNGDCTTTPSKDVPNGFTLDGAGNTITAVNPLESTCDDVDG